MKYTYSTKKGVGTMKIEYKKKAVKYINSCDKSTKRRLKDSIEKLPLGDVKKLTGYECKYRLGVGNLRVLFTFENDIITINEIRPRGKAYKRL